MTSERPPFHVPKDPFASWPRPKPPLAGAGLVEHDTPPGITRLLRLWLALGTDASASMATEAYRCFQERYQITNSALSLNRTIHAAIQQCQLAETPLRAQPTRTHRLMTLRFTLSDAMASLPP